MLTVKLADRIVFAVSLQYWIFYLLIRVYIYIGFSEEKMIFRKLWPNSPLSWFLHIFVWFIYWTILSVGFPKGTALSVHCQWTTHKLQLFLFTSCVSIALYAFVRAKGCVCVEHRGCRWVSKALQLNIRRTMSDEAWLARVKCVCVCVHVSCWFCVLREFFKFDKRTLINHILLYVLICKMIQNQQIEYSSYMECQLCWLQPIFCTVLIERSGIQASQ